MKESRRHAKRLAPAASDNFNLNQVLTRVVAVRIEVCFFASGAAGLMYQVVWSKLLGQLFGYSAYAVATVLAVFMGGIAAGSAVFTRWRPGNRGGIRLYAWMEFAIALTALLSLAGIALVRELYLLRHPHFASSAITLLALRFAGAAIVLGLPTALMGGTLPVMVAAVARKIEELGVHAGRLYAVNTAGAVAGTLAAGFLLIPSVGLRNTLLVAVALNLLAGLLAWRIGSSPALYRSIAEGSAIQQSQQSMNPAEPSLTFYLVCFAAVGATAIAYELGWTRLLATPLGSSTYAFSLMLGIFLLGISIGSVIFEKWFRKKRSVKIGLFATTQLATGAAVLLSLWLYREIPELLLALLRRGRGEFAELLLVQAAASGLVLLPAAVLFGFNFPAVLALLCSTSARHEISISRTVGSGVAANTGGAILAALLGGFFLIPWIGSFRLVAAAAGLNVAIAVLLFLKADARNWKPLLLAASLLLAIVWTSASPRFFSRSVAAFGVVLYRDFHNSALTAREMADTEDVTFFADGINATIAVAQSENYIALKTNGKVDASNLDSGTQLLLGDLGAIFHANPRSVLIIGFGGGMTASAVSRFPEVQRIDCVEIEPAVLQASAHLERLHRGVIHDSRLHVYFDDARNFLQTSHVRYDLIISEPSNPWIAGIATLYTTEFFAIIRDHLLPGGNFVQWIQAYGLSSGDFAMVLASMQPHFRDMTLWHSAGRDFLVLARDSVEPLNLSRARALWQNPQLQPDFASLHLTQPEGWPAYFRLGQQDLRRFVNNSRVNSDDRTILEYTAPRHLLRADLAVALAREINAQQERPFGDSFPNEDLTRIAMASTATALESNSDQVDRFVQAIPVENTSADARVFRARAKLQHGDANGAAQELSRAADSGSNHNKVKYWLAVALQRQGALSPAESTLNEFLVMNPDSELGLRTKADIASGLRNWPAAIEAQTKLAALRPESADEQCRLGDFLLRGRRLADAEAPLRKGLRLDSYAYLCHREWGELQRATGRIDEAIKELEWVERYFPEADSKTYISLALAYQSTGDKIKAEAALAKGRRLFPADALLREFRLR